MKQSLTPEERQAKTRDARHAYYIKNRDRILTASRERYRENREIALAADKEATFLSFDPGDAALLRSLDTAVLAGRRAAIADHIFRTVWIGKPFKGWQDDARDALSMAS